MHGNPKKCREIVLCRWGSEVAAAAGGDENHQQAADH
jgi:hypothetical protein